MLPVLEAKATPYGLCKVAEVAGPPSPLKPPDVPLPAQVMMVPFGHTWRMRWFLESAIKMLPVVESTATPYGLCKAADVASPPSPLMPYEPVPATVVIVPFGHTLRMQWLDESAIMILPLL
jgi:hypothetical protein